MGRNRKDITMNKPFFKVKRECEDLDSFIHGDFCNHEKVRYEECNECNSRVCPILKKNKTIK